MPVEPTERKEEKETQSGTLTENKPADVEEQSEVDEGSQPKETNERTETRIKDLLKERNELKAKLEGKQTENKQSVLDSLRPQAVVPSVAPKAPQQEVKPDDFVDAEGYVDTARLKETLQTAKAEAEQAKIAAQQANQRVARYTETEDMRRVHTDYPTLNPDSKDFDPAFFDLVRDRVISQMTKGGQDVHLAAQEISEIYKSETQKADAEVEAKVQATTTAKEQINASGSSAPKRGSSQEDLVKGTMQGDRQSLFDRMQNSGY